MAVEQWFTAEVINIVDETYNTRRFFFKVHELDALKFTSGQFVTFDLPIHEKKNKRWRSYSFASPPNGSNEFELVIVYVEDGAGTNYLWKEVGVGSTLQFKGPVGLFTLPEEIDSDVCFIATGTGIAPYRSMVLDLINHPRPFKNIYLIFGSRYMKDILYWKELEELQTKLPNFHYIVTLSREDSPAYTGRKGYVHHVYEEIFADKRPARFYLCGWRNMIDEAKQRITEMGYDRKAIHVEIYG